MRLVDYLQVLLRRWWIIALFTLITAGSAYAISTQLTPVYRATQLVLFQPSRADLGLTSAMRLLLDSSVVYLQSSFIASDIIEELQLSNTPDELMANVTIASDSLRLVVQIDYDTTDAIIGADIAEAWGQALVDFRRQQNELNAQEDRVIALLPDEPDSYLLAPVPWVNALAGALLGLLLGILLVFLLEYFESAVVRHRDDLERFMEIPVLAAIPKHD